MSKFNKRIDEMLVVLNAVKRPKPEKEEKEFNVDPVSSFMNDALGKFGMNVVGDEPKSEPESDDEDAIEGAIEDMEDLDLPRPADDADDDDNDDGEDNEKDKDHSEDFDFMSVGNPVDTEPTDTENFKDDGQDDDVSGNNKIKFEFCPGCGVVIGIGDTEVTLSKEQIDTVKQFLSTIPDDFDSESQTTSGSENFDDDDDDGNDDDDDGNDDDDDDDDKDSEKETNFGEARFDDPNPPTKKCSKCGGTMNYDRHSMQYKCTRCHAWEKGKSRI